MHSKYESPSSKMGTGSRMPVNRSVSWVLQALASKPRLWLPAAILLVLLSSPFFYYSSDDRPGYAGWINTAHDQFSAIRNSTLGFEKVVVLSFAARTDKRDLWTLAAAQTGLDLTWIEGVRGEDMPKKAIPAGWNPRESNSTLGCFRAHVNAVQEIVARGWSSALIFEDDAEWDVNIKSQLIEFARGSRYIQAIGEDQPQHSPYGDDWDALWVGHCGANSRSGDNPYYVIYDDPTVVPRPAFKSLYNRRLDDSASILHGKNNYTRVVAEPYDVRCMFAYAVSQRGARKFLYRYSAMALEAGMRTADSAWSGFCSKNVMDAKCIAPFPSLIDNYLAAGSSSKDSDRTQHKDVFRRKGKARNIMFPVKANLETFAMGGMEYPPAEDYADYALTPYSNPETQVYPRGFGVYLSEEEFDTPEDYRGPNYKTSKAKTTDAEDADPPVNAEPQFNAESLVNSGPQVHGDAAVPIDEEE